MAEAWTEAKRRIEVEQSRSLIDWTCKHREVLVSGRPLDFESHPYLVDIYECDAQKMIGYKAGQMGLSEYCISYALHAADRRQATVLYLFPTDTHVQDFSAGRIGPAIEASQYLTEMIVPASGRGADRTTLKRVRDRFVYLRGAKVKKDGSAPQLKSVDADVLILDEVDEMDHRAPSIAVKRLGHSKIAEQRWISTPTYHDVGIHAEWQLSDQREWFVQCWRCGNKQPLEIGDIVTEKDDLERPTDWHGKSEGRAFAACRKCGKELNHLGPGEWVAATESDIVGFHLTRLFSPITKLSDLVKNLYTTDETKRREAFNQDLGLPYTPRGGRLTDEILNALKQDYASGPKAGEHTTMGVDVGRVLNVIIRGAETDNGRPLRYAGEVPTFDELKRLMTEYSVKCCVVDALPETRKAREFQAEFDTGRVFLAYYTSQKAGIKKEDSIQADYSEGTVNLDRTRTMDEMYATIYDGKRPLPAGDIPNYYSQMKAPVRVIEKMRNGDNVAKYVETSADHYAHAENYEQVASQLQLGGGTLSVYVRR